MCVTFCAECFRVSKATNYLHVFYPFVYPCKFYYVLSRILELQNRYRKLNYSFDFWVLLKIMVNYLTSY